MKHDGQSRMEQILRDVPSGELAIVRHFAPAQGRTLLTEQFSAKTPGGNLCAFPRNRSVLYGFSGPSCYIPP